MNSDFKPIIVRDSRIQDISTQIPYVVSKGASSNTFQAFGATSATATGINFNINVPQDTIISREALIQANIKFKVVVPAGVAAGDLSLSLGETEAMQNFPLNSLFTNSTATIGGATMTTNVQDVMAPLLRLNKSSNFSKYACPYLPDKRFKNYKDMILSESNPLSSLLEAKSEEIPRGSYRFKTIKVIKTTTGGAGANKTLSINWNDNDFDDYRAVCTSGHVANDSWEYEFEFETVEPILFLSPFLYGDNNSNNAGIYGVDNLSLVFNIDNSCKRMFSSGSSHSMSISLTGFDDVYLRLNLLTSQPSDLIASKNVLPYYNIHRHIKSGSSIVPNGNNEIKSDSLQLSHMPEKFIIVVRKPLTNQTIKDSNSFLAITRVDITFNNLSGILSGASQFELYNMSKNNGSFQEWNEFYGRASITGGNVKHTTGSILVLTPNDLQTPDYLSAGSIGQFNFSITVSYNNNSFETITPELCVIYQTGGLFITQNGKSFRQEGLLTKDLVMTATNEQHGESLNYVNKDGNGLLSNNSATLLKNVPLQNLKLSGGAMTGGSRGAMSGGANSGLRNFI